MPRSLRTRHIYKEALFGPGDLNIGQEIGMCFDWPEKKLGLKWRLLTVVPRSRRYSLL